MDNTDIYTVLHGHAPQLTEETIRDILAQDFPTCPVLSVQLIPSQRREEWTATLNASDASFVESTIRNDVEMEIIGVNFDHRRFLLMIWPK